MLLTDTHCHLDLHKFDPDRDAVLRRAIQAGVDRILIPGLTVESSRSAVHLAESHRILFSAVGIHPTETMGIVPAAMKEIRILAGHEKVKAIGEIGLDYYWGAVPKETQRFHLESQLELAAELNLPVVIHCREKGDARDGPCASDLLKILDKWLTGLSLSNYTIVDRPGVLHSFSGSMDTAIQAIALNFFLGITGPVTYRKDRQDLVARLPLSHILLETDSPFLAPAPWRGTRNEPAFTALIADKIAECQACSRERVLQATHANAGRLFSWD